MSTPDARPEDRDAVPAQRRRALDEDWLATVVGLALLALVLLGALPGWLVP